MTWVFYAMVVLAIMWPIVLMNIHLRGTMSLFEALANALLISLPFFFIPPRWRWSALVPVWLVALFFLTNTWYWRYFGDFMPVTSYFLWNNVDSMVVGAAMSMFKVKDMSMVIPAMGLTLMYFLFFRNRINRRFTKRVRMAALGIILSLFIGNEAYIIYSGNRIDRIKGVEKTLWESTVQHFGTEQVAPWVEYNVSGLVAYFAKSYGRIIYNNLRSRDASSEDIARIDCFWKAHERLCHAELADSVHHVAALKRNLILIIVESLNSWAVEYEHKGKKLMPVLDSLVKSEGTLSALDMVSQIHSGISSDGQFIYNTGMYPASDVTTVSYYTGNSFHALPMYFADRPSFEVIGEAAAMWKHYETTLAYGYNRLYDNIGRLAKLDAIGRDEAIFRSALEVIDTIDKPFVAELTTITMHGPYKEDFVAVPDWIAGIEGLPEMMRNYMGVANYFDTQLGRFLEELKKRGLYDDSLIVIASDHESPVDKTVDEKGYGRIAFVAVNAGVSRRIDHPVGQVDVFPTILDLMGVSDTVPYRGMGISMLNPRLDGAISRHGKIIGDSISPELEEMLRMSREASDVMLRCDWFGR